MEAQTPVSEDQATVGIHQGPLPRAGQEHRATDDLVRAVESVDGASSIAMNRRDQSVRSSELQVNRSKRLHSSCWSSPDARFREPLDDRINTMNVKLR